MATAPKRKRCVITIEQKLEIIAELSKGKSQRVVVDIFKVAKSTINDIWRYKEKIKRYITINDNPTLVKKRCIIEKIQFEDLDKACNIWFLQQRSKGAPV